MLGRSTSCWYSCSRSAFSCCDSAIAALPLGHAGHNASIFQTVLAQVALQVWMKIAQFAAVKNIVRTDFVALLVLRVFAQQG